MKKLFQDFKMFCTKGNILELATGVMIGGAFTSIVNSLVNDVLMPVIGLVTGGVDLKGLFVALDGNTYETIELAKEAGAATLNYGTFIQTVIDFVLIAICIFAFVKLITKLHKKEEPAPAPAPRKCPFCCQVIDDKATRCPHCTSELPEEK